MDLAIYAHPWDLRALAAHGGLGRLRDLGFSEVALAVSYHAGRWLTPWHPDGMVRFLEDGCVHYRPRADYGVLEPLVSKEVRDGEPSPLEWLCEQAPKAGLRARAWAVVTHNTRLGELHPECCVENAFGDRYSYSLCPSNPAVQRYAVAMVEDLRAHEGLHAVELEALSPIGHRHNSHHDKSSFAADVFADLLLSTCFCASCRARLAGFPFQDASGAKTPIGSVRIDEWRAAFAAALRRRFADGDCLEPPQGKLDPREVLERLRAEFGANAVTILGGRAMQLEMLAMQLSAVLHRPPGSPQLLKERSGSLSGLPMRACLQTNFDVLRGTAALPLATFGDASHQAALDELALTVYGEAAADVSKAIPKLVAARGERVTPRGQQARPALRLCLHPRYPQFQSDDDLRLIKDLCREHGIAAVSIYHLGLLPWRTIERVAKVLSA